MALAEMQRQVARKRELEVELRGLRAKKAEVEVQLTKLEKIKEKEEKDVAKLERGGISNLFRRNKGEKLEIFIINA